MSLRERLRRDTRAAHDVLDADFAQFKLSEPLGYRAFLTCHRRALSQLSRRLETDAKLACEVRGMLDRLDKDLAVLGHSQRPCVTSPTRGLHPISLEYVLLGSHMGMRILYKRWLKVRHPSTKCASAFLSTPLAPERWQAFCAALSHIPDDGSEAETIVADALSIFSIYTQAAKHLSLSYAGG